MVFGPRLSTLRPTPTCALWAPIAMPSRSRLCTVAVSTRCDVSGMLRFRGAPRACVGGVRCAPAHSYDGRGRGHQSVRRRRVGGARQPCSSDPSRSRGDDPREPGTRGCNKALEQFPDVRSVRLQSDRREVRLKPDTTYHTESKTALIADHRSRERFAALLQTGRFISEIPVCTRARQPGEQDADHSLVVQSKRSARAAGNGLNRMVRVYPHAWCTAPPRETGPGLNGGYFPNRRRELRLPISARVPTAKKPLSSRRMLRTDWVHSCQRSASDMTPQTVSGGAEISTEF